MTDEAPVTQEQLIQIFAKLAALDTRITRLGEAFDREAQNVSMHIIDINRALSDVFPALNMTVESVFPEYRMNRDTMDAIVKKAGKGSPDKQS